MTREKEIKMQAEKKAYEPSRLRHPYAKQYKVMSAYEIGFIEGAVWADAHPHWISIDDELPPKQPNREQSKNVLVRTNSGRTKIEYYDYGNDVIKEWWEYNITHWMPLPQAPSSSEFPNNCEKGEEDEDHFIDANKKVDRVIGTADHIKTALDVLNKKGGEE